MRLRAKSRRRLLALSCGVGASLLLVAGTYGALKIHRVRVWQWQRTTGLAAAQQGRWADAVRDLSIYVEHYDDDAAALRAFAEARVHVAEADGGHLRQAISAYEQLVALDPGNVSDRLALTRLYGTSAPGAAPSNNAVIRSADVLLAQCATRSDAADAVREAHALRGAALARLGKIAEARTELAHLRQDAPASLEAVLLDAQIRLAQRHSDDPHPPSPALASAVQTLEDTTAASPASARAAITIARSCEADGDESAAAPAYRLALQFDPSNALAQNNRAMALVVLGTNLDEARALATSATTAQPENAAFFDTLGQVARAQHEPQAAQAALGRACELDPANPAWQIAQAEAFLDAGNSAAARAALAGVSAASLSTPLQSRFAKASQRAFSAPDPPR